MQTWQQRNRLNVLAVVTLLGAIGFAAAQQGMGPAQEQDNALARNPQMQFAQRVVNDGHALHRRVTLMLNDARQGSDPDIIRVPCLDEVLSEIDMRLRTSLERTDKLKSAITSGDTQKQKSEHLMLTVLKQKFSVLAQRANQCVGKDVYETGAARVLTTVQPSFIPSQVNPSVVPLPPPSIVVPVIPPPASPSL